MQLLKKIISFILIAVMLISLFSCGEFVPSQGGSSNKNPNGSGGNNQLDNDPSNDFIVQLRLNDKPYSPRENIDVYWNDGSEIHTAKVDSTGRAAVDGLDGDYRVTLSNVPSGYAYDPNGYVATNDNRIIIIDMYELNNLTGSGKDLYHCYKIGEDGSEPEDYDGDGVYIVGVYTVMVNDPSDFSYVEFSPQTNGIYTVESWVNVVDDEVSPLCLAYYGHSQNKYGEHKVTKVGLCGSYTRNFIHEVNIADENISTGGSQTFTFAVSAETKNGVYPVKLTFAIKRVDEYHNAKTEQVLMSPSHDWTGFDFDAFNALAGGKIANPETLSGGTSGVYVFDESNYKVWPVSKGGDGVYHVYDPEKYPETDGYGPVLVTYITSVFRFSLINLDSGEAMSFVALDNEGNSLIVDSKYNYRLFIVGFNTYAEMGKYCNDRCPCGLYDDDHKACLVGCTDCRSDCVQVTAEEMSIKGYAEYVNADGVVPVTPELKEFLQRYVSTNYYYFWDGNGALENCQHPGQQHSIQSDHASQWLFACGYYE